MALNYYQAVFGCLCFDVCAPRTQTFIKLVVLYPISPLVSDLNLSAVIWGLKLVLNIIKFSFQICESSRTPKT